MTVRAPDAFYLPPAQLPERPGTLIRSEPLDGVTLPPGMRGWRILYTTTVNDTVPATAAAIVLAPADAPAGPRPVIAWAHATTGVPQRCMPSLMSHPALGIPAPAQIAQAGWVVVATDYSFAEKDGPHPYMIGDGEARAVLDAVRAARQLRDLTLDTRTVVWGHSQGGHAALWAGIIAEHYAPDVPISGIAAIAPAADVTSLLAGERTDRRLGPYVALAYSRFYPDVSFEQAVRPEARPAAREIAGLCGFLPREDPQRIAALLATFEGRAIAADDKAFLARLKENAADRPIKAPVLIAQGQADVVVPMLATLAFVEDRCAAGQRLETWTFAGLDHARIVLPGTPLAASLAAWTAARFAGEPQADGCARKEFP